VRTALDRAATRIDGKFAGKPEVEAAIRDTIGETYIDLGLNVEGRKQLERALELRRRVLGADNLRTLETMGHLAGILSSSEAEVFYSQIVRIRRRVLGHASVSWICWRDFDEIDGVECGDVEKRARTATVGDLKV